MLPPEGPGLRADEPAREVLRRLRWPLAHRLGVHTAGDERSRFRGPGIEYADVREYQPSEDARLIDWNLTARSDRPFVRESHQERGLDVWLLVDASRSLDWGTTRALKRDAAREMVDLVTMLLSRHGSRVGAIVFDNQVRRVFPLRGGRQGRLHLMARIEAQRAAREVSGRTDLVATLKDAARLITRPSLVIVISDFLVEPGWQRPLKALSIRHDVVAARISDPREGDLPPIGIVTFEDPETGRQVEVDTSSKKLRARFRAAAVGRRDSLIADIRTARAQILEISTAEPVVNQLIAYLRVRQAMRGGLARKGVR
ncbi:MAG TPA: DUF58 domain-containing protein [Candidatus Dormibacteraeota bacterium]|nr:DUF58 domain-containing protein [Candidatus Dormibacteraeota bacterium]